MRLATCPFNDLCIRTADGLGIPLAQGTVVDLDREIAPGITLEEALGPFAHRFALVGVPDDPPAAPLGRRRRATTETSAPQPVDSIDQEQLP